LEFYGWRKPVVVSRQSGFIVTGHGKTEAALKKGQTQVPVEYQDFESPDIEMGYLTADNAISEWSGCGTDLSSLNELVANLDGAVFPIEMLGLEKFKVDISEVIGGEDNTPEPVAKKCPECGAQLN
jgi:hypothetical protein